LARSLYLFSKDGEDQLLIALLAVDLLILECQSAMRNTAVSHLETAVFD